MTSPIVPVDLKQFFRHYNQERPHGFEIDVDKADFSDVRLSFGHTTWTDNTFDNPTLEGHTKNVTVKNCSGKSSETTVTATPNVVAASNKISIKFGSMKALRNLKATADLPFPHVLSMHAPMRIDLTSPESNLQLPESLKQSKDISFKVVKETKNVSFNSLNQVYQGSFKTVARVRGKVTFPFQQRTMEYPIEELAEDFAQPPFRAENGYLCWNVHGTGSFILEHFSDIK